MEINRFLLENYKINKLTKITENELLGVKSTIYSTDIENLTVEKKYFNNQIRFNIVEKFRAIDCFPPRDKKTHKELLTDYENKDDAIKFCRSYYSSLKTTSTHEYLKSKKITESFKCNESYIVLPVRNIDFDIISLQYINSTEKKFKTNTTPFISKGFYTSEKSLQEKYKYIYICEGFADNLTIKKHIKEKNSLVVSALSLQNMESTYQEMRLVYPNAYIILVLDTNDSSSNYIKILSEDRKKLGVVEIISDNRQVKDINDLYVLDNPVGIKQSKTCFAILNDYKNIFFELNILGADVVGNLYFNSTENNTLIKFNPKFGKRDCKQIAVDAYWIKNFSKKNTNKEGDVSYCIDWNKAIEWLEVETRKKPIFDASNIVSSGVSYNHDDEAFVCNPGEGTDDVIGKKEQDKIYIKGVKYPKPFDFKPLYIDDKTLDVFNSTAFSHEHTGTMLFAWLAHATVCGGLPWRMIGYLTGGSDSGKSTVLNKLANVALKEFAFKVVGDTSYAGLKRGIGSRGIPTLVEEFEFSGKFVEQQKEKFLQLVRNSCSMEGGFKTYQVGEHGVVESFECRSAFLIASIKISMSEPALLNRTIFFTPEGHKANPRQYKELLIKIKKAGLQNKFKGYYARLFKHSEELIEFYNEYLLLYKQYNGKSVGHFSKNMAMTNAILKTLTYNFTNKYTLSPESMLAHSSQGIEEDGTIFSEDTEARVVLNKLRQTIVSYQGAINKEEDSLENFINQLQNAPHFDKGIAKKIYDRTGIYVNNKGRILLNFKHSALDKPCRGIVETRGLRKLIKNEFNPDTVILKIENTRVRTLDLTEIL